MSDGGWFVSRAGNKSGPFSEAELRQQAAAGQLDRADPVWREGMAGWAPAGSVPGVFPTGNVAAPPAGRTGRWLIGLGIVIVTLLALIAILLTALTIRLWPVGDPRPAIFLR